MMRDPTRPLRHLELHPLMPDTIWADNPECFATRELRRYLRLTTGRDWPPAKTPEAAAVVLSLAGLAGLLGLCLTEWAMAGKSTSSNRRGKTISADSQIG